MTPTSLAILEHACETAKTYGWEQNQGWGRGPAKAEREFKLAKGRLADLIGSLEARIAQLEGK